MVGQSELSSQALQLLSQDGVRDPSPTRSSRESEQSEEHPDTTLKQAKTPGGEAVVTEDDALSANAAENPQGRQLGILSATFLIVNRIVGTGVFSTTSTILAQSGSVGMSLLYWVIGAVIAGAGFAVYAEFATAMPRNGGELNYLQHVYRKPKYFVTAIYAAQALLLGQAAGNAYTAGRYFLRAGGHDDTEWGARGIGVGVLLAALIIHGTMLKWGLRFLNAIGTFKLVILVLISISGFAALAGHVKIDAKPDNFSNAFSGSRSDIYGIASCIYNAVWSYVGYSNVFYAMGEVRNPIRTIRIAGPLAMGIITVLYVLTQIAYFAAVPKDDILGSTQIIADLYFRNVFGTSSAKALSAFVALSAVANVFSVIFSQGRLNQALGRDGIIPFSKVFASNRPFNAPLVGLAWHVFVTLILLLAPPKGDAYSLVLNLSSYPLNVVNAGVGLALLAVYLPERVRPRWARGWNPPFRASLPVALFFTLVSIFLVIVPWIPPKKASDAVYEHTWYALAPAVSLGIFALGASYWAVFFWLLPKWGRYELVPRPGELSDGTLITTFEKVKLE